MNRGTGRVLSFAVFLFVFPALVWGEAEAIRLYENGLAHQVREEYYQAVELYKASLELNPFYVLPMMGMAESFYAIGEYDEALTWVGRARIQDKGNSALLNLEGLIRMGLGELETASALFEQVLRLVPNDLDARMGLARLSLAEGSKRNAARHLEDSLRLAPDNVHALLQLALLYDQLGESEASRRHLEKALDYYSDDPQVHLAAGEYFAAQGRLRTAEEYLVTALSLSPNHAGAKLALSRVLIRDQRPDGAIDLLRETLAHESRDVRRESQYLMGLAYSHMGETEGALRSYDAALRLRPDDELVRVAAENLALARPDETEIQRERYARYHLSSGAKLQEKNFLSSALLEFRRSLRLNPAGKDARLRYGNVFRVRGFPFKHLTELIVLRDFYRHTDGEIIDEIEVLEHGLSEGTAVRWRGHLDPLEGTAFLPDQYAVERTPVRLALYTVAGESRTVHLDGTEVLAAYAADFLLASDGLSLTGGAAEAESFQQAYALARQAKSDYFLILAFDESERSLFVSGRLHITRTGAELKKFSHLRTGNGRVRDAIASLAADVERVFPIRGVLLAREFDLGLMDLGVRQGVKVGDRFLIVGKDAITLRIDDFGFDYAEDEIVGQLEVTAVDENVAEGRITARSFFDRINAEDYLLPLPEEKPSAR